MDLNEEKEKVRYAFRLDVKKLIIDKAALGVVAVILGLLANIAIENYKSDLTAQQYFLDKKFDEIKTIRKAYIEMFNIFDNYTSYTINQDQQEYLQKLSRSINQFCRVYTEHSAITSFEFINNMNYQLWIFQALAERDVSKHRVYRGFVYDMYQQFEMQCKKELGILIKKDVLRLAREAQTAAFVEWKKAEKHGLAAFLDDNFTNWQKRTNQERK